MRVLVTGHRGYIGVVLTRMLLDEGFEVTGLDSDLYRNCTFGDPAEIPSVPTILKDVRDVDAADLRDVDAVVHLAALSNDPLGDLDPDLTYAINYGASVRLAEIARAAGVERFVFSSSCSNYGAAGGSQVLDESADLKPLTPYGQSKVMTEAALHGLAGPKFSPTCLRNATAYGVSARHRFDLVLNNLVAWAMTTGSVRLKSDGTPWRPLVHIRDISAAFIAVLRAPTELVHDRTFNVGSTSENYRIRDLAEIVAATVPNCRVEFAPGAAPDARNYRVNCDRIADELGFEPVWTAKRGAEELLRAYSGMDLHVDDFEGPRYLRIAQIRLLLAEGVLDSSLRFAARAPA